MGIVFLVLLGSMAHAARATTRRQEGANGREHTGDRVTETSRAIGLRIGMHVSQGFAKVGQQAPELFDALAAEALPRVHSFSAQSISNFAWA